MAFLYRRKQCPHIQTTLNWAVRRVPNPTLPHGAWALKGYSVHVLPEPTPSRNTDAKSCLR